MQLPIVTKSQTSDKYLVYLAGVNHAEKLCSKEQVPFVYAYYLIKANLRDAALIVLSLDLVRRLF